MTRPADLNLTLEQRIENVAFISAELDAMITGFRHASDMLRTMTPDTQASPCRDHSLSQQPHYLRVVK